MKTRYVTLPWDNAPLTGNDRGPTNGYRARKVADALDQARHAVRAASLEPVVAAEVTLHMRVNSRRRRDADNLAPTLKVCQDALVKEGVLPDDSWIHVPKSGQQIHPPEKGRPSALWLEIRPLERGE